METVDSIRDVGRYASLALDPYGDPHIAYYDVSNADLKHAYRRGSAWTIETVDSAGDVGRYASLALDPYGILHIAYYDVANADLKYAYKTGAIWVIETVDEAGDVGQGASLALDAEGRPHIAYVDATSRGDLKYARRVDAAWSTEIVDSGCSTCFVGDDPALAIDSQDTVHIAYFDRTNADLRYARGTAGAWTIETAADLEDMGRYASLALDAQGAPRIAYYDFSLIHLTGRLRYARKDGPVWTSETVDDSGDVGVNASLKLTTQGEARIAYHTHHDGDLRYATRAVAIGSDATRTDATTTAATGSDAIWSIATVDEAGSVGWYAPLALDAGGNPRFAYYDGTNLDLKYAEGTRSVGLPASAIVLIAFTAEPSPSGAGAVLRWSTEPPPATLTGCRLERADAGGAWGTLVALTHATSHTDPTAAGWSRYRLSAYNERGELIVLGEAALSFAWLPGARLSAWPLPYPGGVLHVSLGAWGAPAERSAQADVTLFDLRGRRVRSLFRGPVATGRQLLEWDGRDDRGQPAAAGVYVLRARGALWEQAVKVVVAR